jgi:hypothetical protein
MVYLPPYVPMNNCMLRDCIGQAVLGKIYNSRMGYKLDFKLYKLHAWKLFNICQFIFKCILNITYTQLIHVNESKCMHLHNHDMI